MTKRQDRDSIYVKRQFDTEIIVLCVRWYAARRCTGTLHAYRHRGHRD